MTTTPDPHDLGADAYRAQRIENLRHLTDAGWAPEHGAFVRTGTLAHLAAAYEEGKAVRAAGRIVARRDMGKSVFAHLQDGTGRFQIYVKKDAVGEAAFAAFKFADLGDLIGVEGTLFTTRTQEKTVQVATWRLLGKALRPLPEKWHGLKDVETRYRQRYLDLIANPEVMAFFARRSQAVKAIRDFLSGEGYQEVETPMMQPLAGGATATPFATEYHALHTTMYLRIAPELYLKRLLVGGFDKVFELNRNFRNEGLSRSHNPEFTMLELYEAYGDARTMAATVQALILHVADTVFGARRIPREDGSEVDLAEPWRTVSYDDLIRERAGADWFDLDRAGREARARELGCETDPAWSDTELTQEVFEKLIERTLVNPTFVTRLPAELVPLARRCPDDPSKVDVFELIIGGWEISPGYTELNDALDQRARLEAQAGHDATRVDEDFLLALEHGMPPAGGAGVGIDRLMMVLGGKDAIRDVILFPQLKARDAEGRKPKIDD